MKTISFDITGKGLYEGSSISRIWFEINILRKHATSPWQWKMSDTAKYLELVMRRLADSGFKGFVAGRWKHDAWHLFLLRVSYGFLLLALWL